MRLRNHEIIEIPFLLLFIAILTFQAYFLFPYSKWINGYIIYPIVLIFSLVLTLKILNRTNFYSENQKSINIYIYKYYRLSDKEHIIFLSIPFVVFIFSFIQTNISHEPSFLRSILYLQIGSNLFSIISSPCQDSVGGETSASHLGHRHRTPDDLPQPILDPRPPGMRPHERRQTRL